nr:MAG TPA: hypothetical protein [Bacteriophage sp.]
MLALSITLYKRQPRHTAGFSFENFSLIFKIMLDF